MNNLPAGEPRRQQIRAKLAKVLHRMAYEGLSQTEAAKREGMNAVSISRALKKPHVQEHLNAIKTKLIESAEGMAGAYKALALQHAAYLCINAKSEAVQARMVEFLAGEKSLGTQVNIAINADRGGYEYVRPGSRVVEIEAEQFQEVGKQGNSNTSDEA
jgi:hypothetical protein